MHKDEQLQVQSAFSTLERRREMQRHRLSMFPSPMISSAKATSPTWTPNIWARPWLGVMKMKAAVVQWTYYLMQYKCCHVQSDRCCVYEIAMVQWKYCLMQRKCCMLQWKHCQSGSNEHLVWRNEIYIYCNCKIALSLNMESACVSLAVKNVWSPAELKQRTPREHMCVYRHRDQTMCCPLPGKHT